MNERIEKLISNMEQVIIGKREVIIRTITAMLAGGHILIEDVPGVGKTMLAASLAKSVNGDFKRIQFTPDVMPSDVTGFTMPGGKDGEFIYRSGAAICNFLLADEINRASPKAQSSLLEVMEELQVSVDGETHQLPRPFMTLATQNPVETYGTYHLPEAQMDRFLMRISIGYPVMEEEMRILEETEREHPLNKLQPVLELNDVLELKQQAADVRVKASVREYLLGIVAGTRTSELVSLGVSPRGSIALMKCAKAYALIDGRDFATPDDIKAVAVPVMAHRLMLSPKGKTRFASQKEAAEYFVKQAAVPAE